MPVRLTKRRLRCVSQRTGLVSAREQRHTSTRVLMLYRHELAHSFAGANRTRLKSVLVIASIVDDMKYAVIHRRCVRLHSIRHREGFSNERR